MTLTLSPTPTASLVTDAAPPTGEMTALIVLAGAIKYWWLYRCPACTALYDHPDETCATPHCLGRPEQLWDSAEHHQYLDWRNQLRAALIERSALTYAPHEAFKGTWVENAQIINDAAIQAADLMVVMSPEGIPTEGTDAEVLVAAAAQTPVLRLPCGAMGIEEALQLIADTLND
jgi:hypothetical protein